MENDEADRRAASTGRFLDQAREALPDWRAKREAQQAEQERAKAEEEAKRSEDAKQANTWLKTTQEDTLKEWAEKRRRQLERGRQIHEQRTSLFSLHTGGVKAMSRGRTDFIPRGIFNQAANRANPDMKASLKF